MRLHVGAYFRALLADAEGPGRIGECILVESWIEHLRQHERVTVADRELQERARAIHIGEAPPRFARWIASPALRGRVYPALPSAR